MKKKLALIFGHTGGIGSATQKLFQKNGFLICPANRKAVDLESASADQEIQLLLENASPDVVINCAGNFVNGYEDTHSQTMNVNFGTNWSIIRHYSSHKNKAVRIIMVGSSAYTGGRQLYPLYSASKAAVYNLWESARDLFQDSKVVVDLVNPVRTLTAMSSKRKQIDPTLQYLEPEQVADEIYKLVEQNQPSRCINMTFEDTK